MGRTVLWYHIIALAFWATLSKLDKVKQKKQKRFLRSSWHHTPRLSAFKSWKCIVSTLMTKVAFSDTDSSCIVQTWHSSRLESSKMLTSSPIA